MLEGEKNLYNQIITKLIKDEHFKKSFINNPADTIKKEFNFSIPEDVKIKVMEDSETEKHIVIPFVPSELQEMSVSELQDIAAGTSNITFMCSFGQQCTKYVGCTP